MEPCAGRDCSTCQCFPAKGEKVRLQLHLLAVKQNPHPNNEPLDGGVIEECVGVKWLFTVNPVSRFLTQTHQQKRDVTARLLCSPELLILLTANSKMTFSHNQVGKSTCFLDAVWSRCFYIESEYKILYKSQHHLDHSEIGAL